MKLISDDYLQVYVWVDGDNESIELSPHFDYEEDAIQWYKRVQGEILDRLGMKVERND